MAERHVNRTRFVLGITGPPGVGKSTLAGALVDALGPPAVLVPMDGFHRYQTALVALGRADRKGAPDTFDVDAYVAVLGRLRAAPDQVVPAPAFDRAREDPVADAIAVCPEHRIVVTEGNYLLLDRGGWEAVRPLLDACWYVDGDAGLRRSRLIARHVSFGRSDAAAEAWVAGSDEVNARLVEATRDRADRIVSTDDEIESLAADVASAAAL